MRPIPDVRMVVGVATLLCAAIVGFDGAPVMMAAQPQPAVRVGGNIPAPRRIRSADPVYPEEAIKARVQGVVIIELTITPAGDVENPRILRGVPMLDQAALDAVTQWKYTPTLLNGVAVPVIMTVTVNFSLAASAAVDTPPPAVNIVRPTPRVLSDEEAQRDPFLLAKGRAGVLQVGMTVEQLYRRIPKAQTKLVDLRENGRFTPGLEIQLEAGAAQPALKAQYRNNGDGEWLVSSLEVDDPRFRTAEGVGVGSTLAEIHAAIPGAQAIVPKSTPPLVVLRDRGLFLWFDPSSVTGTTVPESAAVKRVTVIDYPFPQPRPPAPPAPRP